MAKEKLSTGNYTPGSLPFLDDAIGAGIAEMGFYYEVLSVHESRKRSGWIIKTEFFMIFVWKSDPVCEVLLETVEYLCKINPSCSLSVTPTDTTVEGYELATDSEETRMWVKGKKMRVLDVYSSAPVHVTPEVHPRNRKKP